MNTWQDIFLDTILTLDNELEVKYIERAKQCEQEYNMEYMCTAERVGYRRGFADAIEKAKESICTSKDMLTKLLRIKFQEVPENLMALIHTADDSTLDKWIANFVFANTIDEVFV